MKANSRAQNIPDSNCWNGNTELECWESRLGTEMIGTLVYVDWGAWNGCSVNWEYWKLEW